MGLEKLTLLIESKPDRYDQKVEAMFNPEKVVIEKRAIWKLELKRESDTANTQFTAGEPATLTLNLFFDTYTQAAGSAEGRDVRERLKPIYYLTTVQEHGDIHRPPRCEIIWGKFDISDEYHCKWFLQNLTQTYTLFLPDGTPVRAELNCVFKQVRSGKLEANLLDRKSADVIKTHLVRRGETLSSIAAEEYEDPTCWRPIADANQLVNPRQVAPGTVLIIPTLTDRR